MERFENLVKQVGIICLGIVFIIGSSCRKKDIAGEELVFQSDFEGTIDNKLNGVTIFTYNGSKMSGRYNNSGFKLFLNSLPGHGLIKVSFNLYLHDTWAGNNIGDKDVTDGPDIWQMIVDGNPVINTTFSNSGCFDTYCQQQSWPRNYPFHHDAGTGAARKDLPGVCHLAGIPGGTTMYRIEKLVDHDGGNLTIEFKDILKQSNSSNPPCDESWSLDNLSVSVVRVK